MAKIVSFDTEARVKLKSGIDQLANAVKVTLGPKGRHSKKFWCSNNHKRRSYSCERNRT